MSQDTELRKGNPIDGYLSAIQNIIALRHDWAIAEDLISESGYSQKALLEAQQEHGFKSAEVVPLILQNTENIEGVESTIDGKQVTHACFTPDYVVLYHEPEAEKCPSPETDHEPLNGWPEDWPPYVTRGWIKEATDVKVCW